jgi:hypothetical protein
MMKYTLLIRRSTEPAPAGGGGGVYAKICNHLQCFANDFAVLFSKISQALVVICFAL